MCDGKYNDIRNLSQSANERPEEKLAKLLKSAADTSINPTVLKLFLAAHWNKVSKLAHEIHEGTR
jgi:hypothetical protein